MVIGVDAYFLYEKNNTGIGTLNMNLFRAIAKIDDKNIYYLFTPEVRHRDVADELTQNKNIKIIEVDGIFEKSRRLWLQGVKLRNAICREGVELFFGGGEYIPLLLPQRIKCVVTIHDMVFALFHETLTVINKISYRTLFRLCVRKSSAVITVSNDSKEDIMKYLNIDGGKIFVAYNGIDLEKFRMRKKNKKGITYFLWVRCSQEKIWRILLKHIQ